MKNLLNPDGLLFQFLNKVGDLIIVNFLFLICCVPVVTIGASIAALNKITQEIVYDTETGIFKGFFRAFRENFKQATLCWLGLMVIGISFYCDFLLIRTFLEGTAATALNTFVLVLAMLLLCLCVYLFPLMVRYRNTLREHLINSGILMVVKLPRTVAMAALNLLPVILFLLNVTVFAQTLIFWLFIGFAFVSYLCGILLKPVFAQLEKGNNAVTVG